MFGPFWTFSHCFSPQLCRQILFLSPSYSCVNWGRTSCPRSHCQWVAEHSQAQVDVIAPTQPPWLGALIKWWMVIKGPCSPSFCYWWDPTYHTCLHNSSQTAEITQPQRMKDHNQVYRPSQKIHAPGQRANPKPPRQTGTDQSRCLWLKK